MQIIRSRGSTSGVKVYKIFMDRIEFCVDDFSLVAWAAKARS
jgi:hypothetical protein